MRRFVTVRYIMEATQLSRTSAYELMHRLGAVRIGRSVRVSKMRVDAFLRELETGDAVHAPQAVGGDEDEAAVVGASSADFKPQKSANRLRWAAIVARAERSRRGAGRT